MPTSDTKDVVIIGAGIAGLTAALRLGDLDVCVLEQDGHVGGRTYSRRFSGQVWANFGAQYLLPDKAGMVRLAESVGVGLITVPHVATHDLGVLPSGQVEEASLAETGERLAKEQANPRDPTLPELDDASFAEWLGERSAGEMAAWEHWSQSSISGSIIHMSLYGALVLWGKHRSGAFDDDPVIYHDRGECVVAGGTGSIADAIATALGERIRLGARVLGVSRAGEWNTVVFEQQGEVRVMQARTVVSAVPSPIAADLFQDLPEWKRALLRSVPYGRFLSTPIKVTSAGQAGQQRRPVPFRPGQSYNDNLFLHRTPGDVDEVGGCFHSYMYDAHARVVWDDDDESVMAGAVNALLLARPDLAGRIDWVGVKRWRYGNPQYFPGRMKALPGLCESVGGIHFGGDYTDFSNTEGALRSGERVAREVLAEHGRG
jgi:protoporphyrinogen/coproporphyrinogen III oxidase